MAPVPQQEEAAALTLAAWAGAAWAPHLVGPRLELHKYLSRVAPVGGVVEHPLDLLHYLANLIRHNTALLQLEHAQQSAQQRAGTAALALDDVVQARIGAAVHVGHLHRGQQLLLVRVDSVPAQHSGDVAEQDQHDLVHADAIYRMQHVHRSCDGHDAQLGGRRKTAHAQQQLDHEVDEPDRHRLDDEARRRSHRHDAAKVARSKGETTQHLPAGHQPIHQARARARLGRRHKGDCVEDVAADGQFQDPQQALAGGTERNAANHDGGDSAQTDPNVVVRELKTRCKALRKQPRALCLREDCEGRDERGHSAHRVSCVETSKT
eukprot:scaffold16470_cov120-Isochrysis_galbana.AAC.10